MGGRGYFWPAEVIVCGSAFGDLFRRRAVEENDVVRGAQRDTKGSWLHYYGIMVIFTPWRGLSLISF